MRQPKNDSVRRNPAGENTAAPSPLPKNDVSMNRRYPEGTAKSTMIPSTLGNPNRKSYPVK